MRSPLPPALRAGDSPSWLNTHRQPNCAVLPGNRPRRCRQRPRGRPRPPKRRASCVAQECGGDRRYDVIPLSTCEREDRRGGAKGWGVGGLVGASRTNRAARCRSRRRRHRHRHAAYPRQMFDQRKRTARALEANGELIRPARLAVTGGDLRSGVPVVVRRGAGSDRRWCRRKRHPPPRRNRQVLRQEHRVIVAK